MKRAILAVLVFTMFVLTTKAQDKPVWTAEYEQAVYTGINTSVKNSVPDDAQRQKLVTYVVARLKKALPDGLQSIPADSLHKLSMKIGADYAAINPDAFKSAITRKVAWSPEVENLIRRGMNETAQKAGIKLNDQFCDCAIARLKKIYPDSLVTPTSPEMNTQVARECAKELQNGTKQNQ